MPLAPSRHPQWLRDLKVGDVIWRPPNGAARVVRGVKYLPHVDIGWVELAIRRCSWTGRALTTISFGDLRYLGYQPTGWRWAMRRRMDKRLAKCVADPYDRSVSCCDVHGVP